MCLTVSETAELCPKAWHTICVPALLRGSRKSTFLLALGIVLAILIVLQKYLTGFSFQLPSNMSNILSWAY